MRPTERNIAVEQRSPGGPTLVVALVQFEGGIYFLVLRGSYAPLFSLPDPLIGRPADG